MKVVSFDVDGTLVDHTFVNMFWEREVPKLYAEKHGISFEEAWERVKKSYDEIGDEDIRWYLPSYWFKKFELDIDPREVLEDLKSHVKIFPDALETIEELHGRFEMIIVSNAPSEILDIEIEEIREYFSRVYSCTSQFREVRKNPQTYMRVCREIKVPPSRLVHVGDHYKFDYEVPKKLGINAFLIDRENTIHAHDGNILRDLRELISKL